MTQAPELVPRMWNKKLSSQIDDWWWYLELVRTGWETRNTDMYTATIITNDHQHDSILVAARPDYGEKKYNLKHFSRKTYHSVYKIKRVFLWIW